MAKGKKDVADEDEDLGKDEWYLANGEGDFPEVECIEVGNVTEKVVANKEEYVRGKII